jgi:hypothetical protein
MAYKGVGEALYLYLCLKIVLITMCLTSGCWVAGAATNGCGSGLLWSCIKAFRGCYKGMEVTIRVGPA